MPRGDQTGPTGAGPMTGRGAGYCAGFANPAMPPRGPGFGFGGGRRGGRHMFYTTGLPGWQRFGNAPLATQQEAVALKAQADWLKAQLDAIDKRIEELGRE
jgi:hypothetical protein